MLLTWQFWLSVICFWWVLSAVFFLAGLGVALWRERRRAYLVAPSILPKPTWPKQWLCECGWSGERWPAILSVQCPECGEWLGRESG